MLVKDQIMKREDNSSFDRNTAGVATFLVSDWRYGAKLLPDDTVDQVGYGTEAASRCLSRYFKEGDALLRGTAGGKAFDGCVVAFAGGMVDTRGSVGGAASQALCAEAAGLVLSQLIRLLEIYGDVYVPCLIASAGTSKKASTGATQRLMMGNADVVFYEALKTLAAPYVGIDIDVSHSIHQWDIYDNPFVMAGAIRIQEDAPHSANWALSSAAELRADFIADMESYRPKNELDRTTLFMGQAGFSLCGLDQGVIGNKPMTGELNPSAVKQFSIASPCWHVCATLPGIGITGLYRVYGVDPMPEDAQSILERPPISRGKTFRAQTAPASNVVVGLFM